jgi:hypothetical protein
MEKVCKPFLKIILVVIPIVLVGYSITLLFLYEPYGFKPSNDINSLSPDLSEGNLIPSSPPPTSNLNISELPSFDLPSFDTSPMDRSSLMPDVIGMYSNPDIGFQLDLPKDWKGKEIKFLVNTVFAAPPEVDLSELQVPGTFMIISGINQDAIDKLTSIVRRFSAPAAPPSGAEVQGPEGFANPLDITSSYGNEFSCQKQPPSIVNIKGIAAEEGLADCIDQQGRNVKTKTYSFVTKDESIITLGFLSNLTSEYNENLPLFEESVRTIQVSNPGDTVTSQIYNKLKQLESSQTIP